MSTEPIVFLRTVLPDLFNRGMAQTKTRAEGGNPKAKARFDDAAAARGAVRVLLEGEGGGEVWLAVESGAMKALDARPDNLPVRMVVAAPADAARAGLEELQSSELLERDEAPRRFIRTASAEVEKMLEGHRIEMHLTLTDLPADPDEVTLRVGLGVAEPPSNPRFTASVSWDDIEDLRAGDLTPQQLLGRLKLKGDASQAMALGMALMQRRQTGR